MHCEMSERHCAWPLVCDESQRQAEREVRMADSVGRRPSVAMFRGRRGIYGARRPTVRGALTSVREQVRGVSI